MTKRFFILVLAVAMILMSVVNVFAQDQSIVEIATNNEDFSTLASLVEAAGLVDTLSGEGAFTVFAPTNEAFAALPQVVVDYLLANPDALTQVLTYHVVAGTVLSTDLVAGDVATLDMGNTVTVSLADGVKINNANVVIADIVASNGVVHVIDTVLLPPVELEEVDPLMVFDNIVAAGSSTVYPLTERMADLFNQEGFAGTITVDSVGTGAGFERFCVAENGTDISNASRPIRESEVETCVAAGLQPFSLYVAIDALAVTVSVENDFVDSLSFEQLAQIYSGEAATWADVNPEWPAEAIRLFAPGSDSGTYDYFVEEIYDEDETMIQNAPGIQFSEDDNVLVQGVEGSPYAIGFFGFAYYQENQALLRAVAVEGVEPSEETGTTGAYPLSRPLFVYSSANILSAKPQVASFLSYYIQNANSQLGTASDQIGYIPTNAYIGRANAWTLIAASAE